MAESTVSKFAPHLKSLYRSPREYPHWNIVLCELIVLSGLPIGPKKAAELMARDSVSACALLTSHFLLANQIPTRYITASIGESFLKTELPERVERPELPYPGIVLVLPRGLLNAEDGRPIDCLLICDNASLRDYILDKFNVDVIEMNHPNSIRILAITSAGECFGSVYFWNSPEENAQRKILTADHEDESDEVIGVLHQIDRLAVNAWLTLSYCPEFVSTGPIPASSSAVKGINAKGKKVPMCPTYIGWEFKRVTSTQSTKTGVATGRKLRMHWRKGHWSNLAYGPQRKQRKPVWIKPVLVNSHDIPPLNV